MTKLHKLNESYIKIETTPDILREMSEYFKFQPKDYRFNPRYKNKMWDGYIRLVDMRYKTIYLGLYEKIIAFFETRNYPYEFTFPINNGLPYDEKAIENKIKSFDIPNDFTLMEHQKQAVFMSQKTNRALFESATSSGKSLMIYTIYRMNPVKTLLIVPNLGLVHQMGNDFTTYGYTEDVHKLYAEQESYSDANITIATWQSAVLQNEEWFKQFKQVFVDEAHHAKAKSIKYIMENLVNCSIRYGFTGTLDKNMPTDKHVLEGLFGPIKVVIKTAEMIEKKISSDLAIKCIVLNYPVEDKKIILKRTKRIKLQGKWKTVKIPGKEVYQSEIEFIMANQKRNEFIKKLCGTLKGNTLVLFQYIEKHGDLLYDNMKNIENKKVYYIHGKVAGEDREKVKAIMENEENVIVLASLGTFGEGVSIKNIHKLVTVSPSKAKIQVLQAIGRSLRKSKTKTKATLYDIADNFSINSRKNYAILHLAERIRIYAIFI